MLCWAGGGSVEELRGCELPECCNTVRGERCGLPYPTVAAHWCSAMPLACALAQHPTPFSSEEPGPTLDMKSED